MDICSFSSHLIGEAEDDNTEWKKRRRRRRGRKMKEKGQEYQKWFVGTARIDERDAEKEEEITAIGIVASLVRQMSLSPGMIGLITLQMCDNQRRDGERKKVNS
jgi:hypothetical protein